MTLIYATLLLVTIIVGIYAVDAVLLHKKSAIWWAAATLTLVIVLSGLPE